MSDSQPYAKVTVTVEFEDGDTVTYNIPKARQVGISNYAIPVSLEGRGLREYLQGSIDLEFRLTADFDEANGHVYTETFSKIAEEVKPNDNG